MSVQKNGKKVKSSARRKFLKAGVAGVAGGTAALAMPSIATAAPTVLKVQAAWGGGIFLEDAKNYVKRVNDMAGSGLRIDLPPYSVLIINRVGLKCVEC